MARVVFMGTPEFAVPTLAALLGGEDQVVGVFTQPDRPKGRGGKVTMSPVKELAMARGVPVFQPSRIRADGMEDLRALKPDLCVTAAFGQILSQEVLDIPPMGTVNVHASLLPRHRGAAPVQWAILQGDSETGVTTMLTDQGIDTGDMLLKARCPIAEEDTAGTLLNKLSHIGAELLMETVARLKAANCPREKQMEEDATYDPMLRKEMGLLHFDEGIQPCLRRVRAMDPWPCAYASLAEGVLKVWQAAAAQGDFQAAAPGTILAADAKSGVVVATADGAMELLEVQAPNGKRMDARAFLRGHALKTGKLLHEVKV